MSARDLAKAGIATARSLGVLRQPRDDRRWQRALVRDPVLQFPDAEGSEQQALGSRQGSDSGQFSLDRLGAVVLPGTTALALGFADTARGFTNGEMTSVVHAS